MNEEQRAGLSYYRRKYQSYITEVLGMNVYDPQDYIREVLDQDIKRFCMVLDPTWSEDFVYGILFGHSILMNAINSYMIDRQAEKGVLETKWEWM